MANALNYLSSSSTPAKSSKPLSKVRVIVRVRPFLDYEHSNRISCISLLPNEEFDLSNEVSVLIKDQETSRNERYKLDGYFDQEDNNVGKIFEKEVKGLIPGIFNGCNATVFTYGATGGGKTFTMEGTDEQPGLMTRAMLTVLSTCQKTGNTAAISYYEVYLDRCYDLLESKTKEISVLDDKEGQIHLRGLSCVPVNSLSEFHDVFACGIQRRKVAHTGLNDVSSRSHAVLVISVAAPSDNGVQGGIIGKINLIDLAGNEDNKKSGNDGIRLLESAKINQSLFALSNVIYALNNNKPWVPFRESKLTRILQDSLGGRSRSLMVACLSPSDYQEATHTVAFAARSRNFSNVIPSLRKQDTSKIRTDMEAKLRAWLALREKTRCSRKTKAFGSPFFLTTPGHGSLMKKQLVHHRFAENKVTFQEIHKVLDRVLPQRKLFDSEATSDYGEEEPIEKNIGDECILDGSIVKTTMCLPDERLLEDERANNLIQSPANRIKILSCQSPQRKVLSPINTAITNMAINEVSTRNNVLSALLESNTPQTPFTGSRQGLYDFKTPLDKFNASRLTLKSHLVQEYIAFLNSATREELVELKGIGVKRAEYIMELRDSSPLKSLSDLQKIGLSSKQVQHLLNEAAKSIF